MLGEWIEIRITQGGRAEVLANKGQSLCLGSIEKPGPSAWGGLWSWVGWVEESVGAMRERWQQALPNRGDVGTSQPRSIVSGAPSFSLSSPRVCGK